MLLTDKSAATEREKTTKLYGLERDAPENPAL